MLDRVSQAGAAEAPFIAIENASMRYGEGDDTAPLALEGLTLNIGRGEFAAVVGPSGCGKSTLMKMLSGLVPASAGSVVVDGEEVRRPIKIVGMAFQNPALLPWRTVLQNVLLPVEVVAGLRQQYRTKPSPFVDRAMALLAKVGLADARDRYGWQLSGGMQQRVSLCRALMHDPEILLLDEPFGALDTFTREELWDSLKELWQQRKCTVVLVTHDLVEAVYLADNIHVMSSRPGRIGYSVAIDLPRPRTSEVRYTPAFTEYVHVIRSHIAQARDGKCP